MVATRTPKTSDLVQDGKENQSSRKDWEPDFLAHLAETSNVTKSADFAKVQTSTVYRARREDPDFAQKWLAALWEGYVHLEMEVLRRLRDGDQKTSDSDKYDFSNAIRLLAAHRDNAARAQAAQRSVSAAEIRASIDRKVEGIRRQVKAEREASKTTKSNSA